MSQQQDYRLEDPTWCPGCGLYGIFSAFKKAAKVLDLDPQRLVMVTGIGCHGRFNNYFRCYGFHALHGRTLPVASGIKLSNPRLEVVVISGDGDAYSIGLSHFIHSARKNINIMFLVVNNQVFALTQGQTSPTSERGYVSISTPMGAKERPLDGPLLALAAGATFVARGFSGDQAHLITLIEKAYRHQGFALLEVLSPCVTHNKINTYQWFRKNIYKLEEDSAFNPEDRKKAWDRVNKPGKIPVGLMFKGAAPTYESLICPDQEKPLAEEELKVEKSRLEEILEKFE
ncbi:MAG: 2-oxoacid:ferredoxin oxidoreductase subunit beta [Candidatus Aminicenantes bacterium]